MQTSTLIQILVFALAGFIVLIFISTGIHFVRAVLQHYAVVERQQGLNNVLNQAASAIVPEPIPLVDLKQKDGIIILQPDGLEDLALRVESEDERALKSEASKSALKDELERSDEPISSCVSDSNRGQSNEGRCRECGRSNVEMSAETSNLSEQDAPQVEGNTRQRMVQNPPQSSSSNASVIGTSEFGMSRDISQQGIASHSDYQVSILNRDSTSNTEASHRLEPEHLGRQSRQREQVHDIENGTESSRMGTFKASIKRFDHDAHPATFYGAA